MKKSCVGAGFIALDILKKSEEDVFEIFCGGSVGNVCSILSFKGWLTTPIGRLSNSEESKLILDDLLKLKVHTELLEIEPKGITPIVVQENFKRDSQAQHRFKFFANGLSTRMPVFRPPLLRSVERITSHTSIPFCFYFDRLSPAILKLARFYKNAGSLIFFEPSSINNTKQFEEAAEIAHVIKFSAKRSTSYQNTFSEPLAPFEIETLGAEGLQYRVNGHWQKVNAKSTSSIVDTAGAGDWLSAELISLISEFGMDELVCNNDLPEILYNAQTDSVENCKYHGAKGWLYHQLDGMTPHQASKENLADILGDSF